MEVWAVLELSVQAVQEAPGDSRDGDQRGIGESRATVSRGDLAVPPWGQGHHYRRCDRRAAVLRPRARPSPTRQLPLPAGWEVTGNHEGRRRELGRVGFAVLDFRGDQIDMSYRDDARHRGLREDDRMTATAEHRDAGARLRREKPPEWMRDWRPATDRDPKALLDAAATGRDQELVDQRNELMAKSAPNFLRGAAGVMAADLDSALTRTTGIGIDICGDAHLGNFGMYASPERRRVFDLTDFDEARPGPWEWDAGPAGDERRRDGARPEDRRRRSADGGAGRGRGVRECAQVPR